MYRSQGYETDLAILKRLQSLGVRQVLQEEAEVFSYLSAVSAFLESYDFMKLGQAIQRGQWNSVMMTLRRLDVAAKNLKIDSLARQLSGLRLAAAARETAQAKQILALLVAKRVQLLKVMKDC